MTASAALRAALLLAACCMAFGKHLCGAFARLQSAARSHCGGLSKPAHALLAGVGPAWYKCDDSNCKPPECLCASDSAPGGLAPDEVPQVPASAAVRRHDALLDFQVAL